MNEDEQTVSKKDILESMSIDAAIECLTSLSQCISESQGRGNGKTTILLSYQIALLKAIEALKNQKENKEGENT